MSNRSRGQYDIVLDDGTFATGFTLAREQGKPAVVTTELSPARLDAAVRNADVPRVIDNLDAGMGFSRRVPQVPNGYAYCLPGYTRAPGGIFCPAGKLTEIAMPPAPPAAGSWQAGIITASELFNGSIYLLIGARQILKLAPGGTTVAAVQDLGPAWIGRGMAVFNNRLYVSSEAGLAYLDAAGTWSAVQPGVQRTVLGTATWRPLGVPTPVLIGVSLSNNASSVRWCPITADPMDDSKWSAPVQVGTDGHYPISQIVTAPLHAYFARPDGLYDMDELGARAFNTTPWMRETVDLHNGIWATHVGRGAYYSHTQGLAYIDTMAGEAQYHPEWAHPGWGLPYEGPVTGLPTAGTLHNGWGLLGLRSPPINTPGATYTSYVMAGRRDESGAYGQATHVWHGAEAIVPDGITHMKVYTDTWEGTSDYPKLLICTVSYATSPPTVRAYWQSLTRIGSPIQEMLWGGAFEPADSASLFLPADPWDRPSSVKTLLHLEMVTERLDPGNRTLQAYARADGGAWSDQGLVQDSPYGSLAPLETTEGRFIDVRVDAVGSSILRSLELRSAVGVELREARSYRVVLGYDDALKTPRGRETRDPEGRYADLVGMLGRVVTLHAEVPMRVRVLQVLAPERRQLSAPNRAGAWAMVVPILVSILDKPFQYDGRDQFDTDRTWG